MYASGYNKLFWGMIFIIFDINLGQINILPNFIGYILIYSGLKVLESQHEIYTKGKKFAAILTIMTLGDISKGGISSYLKGTFQSGDIWVMIMSTVVMIVNLCLIYIICRGIYLISIDKNLEDLKEDAQNSWKFYFIITTIYLFYMPFSINFSQDFNIVMTIIGIVNIFASIYVMSLFRMSRTQLKE